MKLVLHSFGYKYGAPDGVNLLLDVRALPNPFWVETLRPFTGKEKDVADYVLESEAGKEFLKRFLPFFEYLLQINQEKGSHSLVVAIGCTGGRHRSVALVERIALVLADCDLEVIVFHRDILKDSH